MSRAGCHYQFTFLAEIVGGAEASAVTKMTMKGERQASRAVGSGPIRSVYVDGEDKQFWAMVHHVSIKAGVG